jgi:hypothetical protein
MPPLHMHNGYEHQDPTGLVHPAFRVPLSRGDSGTVRSHCACAAVASMAERVPVMRHEMSWETTRLSDPPGLPCAALAGRQWHLGTRSILKHRRGRIETTQHCACAAVASMAERVPVMRHEMSWETTRLSEYCGVSGAPSRFLVLQGSRRLPRRVRRRYLRPARGPDDRALATEGRVDQSCRVLVFVAIVHVQRWHRWQRGCR